MAPLRSIVSISSAASASGVVSRSRAASVSHTGVAPSDARNPTFSVCRHSAERVSRASCHAETSPVSRSGLRLQSGSARPHAARLSVRSNATARGGRPRAAAFRGWGGDARRSGRRRLLLWMSLGEGRRPRGDGGPRGRPNPEAARAGRSDDESLRPDAAGVRKVSLVVWQRFRFLRAGRRPVVVPSVVPAYRFPSPLSTKAGVPTRRSSRARLRRFR